MKQKIIIIGGGAAGFFTSIVIAENKPNLDIIILEKGDKVLQKVKAKSGNKVAILGVAYKANVDDCRETPAEPILQHLLAEGCDVKYHDPHVPQWQCEAESDLTTIMAWADICLIVTGHECYKTLSQHETLIDACGILK